MAVLYSLSQSFGPWLWCRPSSAAALEGEGAPSISTSDLLLQLFLGHSASNKDKFSIAPYCRELKCSGPKVGCWAPEKRVCLQIHIGRDPWSQETKLGPRCLEQSAFHKGAFACPRGINLSVAHCNLLSSAWATPLDSCPL